MPKSRGFTKERVLTDSGTPTVLKVKVEEIKYWSVEKHPAGKVNRERLIESASLAKGEGKLRNVMGK